MSSSESDEENIRRCQEAADTALLNDAMFKTDQNGIIHQQGYLAKNVESIKSNRYLEAEKNVFQSDINVTEAMKKFVGKKLSMLIEQNITFVELHHQTAKNTKSFQNYDLKLLRDCDSYLNITDIEERSATLSRNKKMIPIRKRNVEPENMDEKEKTHLAAMDSNAILVSTKYWTNRPKAKVYVYKTYGSLNVIQEDQSEFSALKRKNNWNMSKIETYRKKNKTQ